MSSKHSVPRRKPSKPKVKKPARKKAQKRTKVPVLQGEQPKQAPRAVVMAYRSAPGHTAPGPYCEVLAKCYEGTAQVKRRIWVRVEKGDDRNGTGKVINVPSDASEHWQVGAPVRFAGGTAQSPALVVGVPS